MQAGSQSWKAFFYGSSDAANSITVDRTPASLVGFGFLTKMLQALLVVPAFALVYLVAAPTTVRSRIGHLLAAGPALPVSAG